MTVGESDDTGRGGVDLIARGSGAPRDIFVAPS